MMNRRWLFLILAFVMIAFNNMSANIAQDAIQKPEPKVIRPNIEGKDYCRILGGPPESIVMRSGMVLLQPNKTVGKHNTEVYEELVIVLKGLGEMMLSDGKKLEMKEGNLLYCPPDTEHDVKNTGSLPLQYIYVVARAK